MKTIPIIIRGIIRIEDDEDTDAVLNEIFETVSVTVGLLELEVKEE